MNKQDLIPLVEKVAELRNDFENMIKNRDLLHQKLTQIPEIKVYDAVCEDIGKLSEDLMMAEAELKERAIWFHHSTGEKKPVDKVEIKIFKHLEYDPAEALAWCFKKAPALLVVDKKQFEKGAGLLGAPVKVKEEAKCTIGTDLSEYLKQTKEEVKTDG